MRDPALKKAAVPKRDEKPIHGLVSDKNFIVANAVENILAGKWPPPVCLFYEFARLFVLRQLHLLSGLRFEFERFLSRARSTGTLLTVTAPAH